MGGDEWALVQEASGAIPHVPKKRMPESIKSGLFKHGLAVQALLLTFIGHLSPGVPTESVWALGRANEGGAIGKAILHKIGDTR